MGPRYLLIRSEGKDTSPKETVSWFVEMRNAKGSTSSCLSADI